MHAEASATRARSGHEQLLAAASKYTQRSGPADDAGCRRLLPRAQHGGRRLLRRRRSGHGRHAPSNDEVVQGGRERRRLIPFASIDPTRATASARPRLIAEYPAIRGFSSTPTSGVLAQRPRLLSAVRGDRRGGPDLLFHTGQTGWRRDAGRRRCAPKYLIRCVDDVAAASEMNIILAHPSFLQEEAPAVATTSRTSGIDLVGLVASTSRRSSCATSTPWCATRCCSA